MKKIQKKLSKQLRFAIILFNLCWTSIFFVAYLVGVSAEESSVLALAAKEAEAGFNKDLVYRRWAASHGGVYVPTTQETPPNVFLNNIPERDLTTPTGQKLTLVNPAYMTRQVYELAQKQYGVQGHITSLNPIRPGNEPDIWERKILDKFSEGLEEYSSVEQINGKPYLRYMKRLIVEKNCLKCHAEQGYKEGDVRGGISTSVPLSEYYTIATEFKGKYILILTPIWLLGIVLFNLGAGMLKRQVKLSEETQNQLEVQSDLLNKSQEIAQLGSWHLDIKRNILTWSDEQYRIFGVTPQEFGANYEAFLNTIHPEDKEMVDKTYTNAIENNQPYECIHRIIKHDGEVRVVLEKSEDVVNGDGEVIHSYGFTQDITELKAAEAALKENEERFRKAVTLSPLPLMIHSEDGEVIFINELWKELTGYTEQDIPTIADWTEKAYGERKEDNREYIANLYDLNRRVYEGLYNVTTKDGRTLTWDFCSAPLGKLTDGKRLVISKAKDVTEQLAGENERRNLEDRLRQAQKMEAIGTLAGGIAHDFNNILGAILGYSELVQEDCPAGSMMRNDIDQVVEASYRAKELVKQILAFSRQTETDVQALQPAIIIKEAIKMLRASLPATIDIQQVIDQDVGLVFADPTEIHQILTNLCTNAYHSMEKTGGTLSISLKNKELNSADLIHEPHLQPGLFVEISVRDTGHGISRHVIDKIFDPFFTTKEVGKGTGMGLSIIHGIVKKSNGFVCCQSVPDEGTTFHVYLPVHAVGALPIVETASFELIQTGVEHILFIDDEEMLAVMGKTMLERLGYRVTMETDSIEALKIIKDEPNRFDLVITDQTMPGMTGSDLARRILQIRPGMPIILCTGFSNLISREKARIYGIKGFVMKPLAKKDLAALIRKVLDGEQN
ncbi:PAS domain S-box protein [Desulfopila sp. IMCC35008]|uniref:PAS domain S-box protein n=1 Tax=Desulfopila sp. IMCC35008 TaxID=2653858 RepID=UPI0013D3D7B1|nr:PAS domain S-box protein [Desulfopila sp. IMCC35008]